MASVGGSKTRIDMTPMVDLGFLLLTFFVLTTSMSTPTVMQVTVPAPNEDVEEQDKPDEVPAERVLTMIATGENRLYYYEGKAEAEDRELNLMGYEGENFRKLIRRKQEEVLSNPNLKKFDDRDLIVMLKISEDASYKNMVDILDEMAITDQSKYMLVDVNSAELGLIYDYEENQGMESSIEKSIERFGLPESDEE